MDAKKRCALALELRKSGMTMKSVGEHIGVGPQRAAELVRRAERLLERGTLVDNPENCIPWLSSLHRTSLAMVGIKTEKDLSAAIDSGAIVFTADGVAFNGKKLDLAGKVMVSAIRRNMDIPAADRVKPSAVSIRNAISTLGKIIKDDCEYELIDAAKSLINRCS